MQVIICSKTATVEKSLYYYMNDTTVLQYIKIPSAMHLSDHKWPALSLILTVCKLQSDRCCSRANTQTIIKSLIDKIGRY